MQQTFGLFRSNATQKFAGMIRSLMGPILFQNNNNLNTNNFESKAMRKVTEKKYGPI